jgi:hypothetical protein
VKEEGEEEEEKEEEEEEKEEEEEEKEEEEGGERQPRRCRMYGKAKGREGREATVKQRFCTKK